MTSRTASTRFRRGGAVLTLCATMLAAAASAQVAAPVAGTRNPLDLPNNPTIFGSNPTVRKATAIVNGHVLTQTDIDHRVALSLAASDGQIPPQELERLRLQVFRNLIDETLQIQEAKANQIVVSAAEIDQFQNRVATNFGKNTPAEFDAYLRGLGSSTKSIRRQIEGELAWRKLQSRKIEAFVNVGDEEVQAIIDKLNASKGTQEYRIGEIFLAATPETQGEAMANAERIIQQVRNGGSFLAYARQFSQASTAAVGGDLGWVRPEQLPDPLAAAARALPTGQISPPIPVDGGVSIIAVQDSRQVLTADPKDAQLTLKQVSITFPKGTTQDQARPTVEAFAAASRSVGGCGKAEELAARFKGEVVQSDSIRIRDLPPVLQNTMMNLQIGQATNPFGSLDESIRVLVLCGRDEPEQTNAPSFDRIYAQLNEERTNRRAQRYLRDLRRDAVVDYR
ncbi:MAG TPA: peptidylprolyl isomerase [Sphingomonadaceae bacterium]|nr:peptidylprolyl isomerase [Sphingomonadaceae bacterium]